MAAAGSSSLRQRRTTIPLVTSSETHVPLANGSINVMMETTPIPSRRKTDVVEVVKPPDPVLSSPSAQLVVAKDEGRTRKILVRATSGALMVCTALYFVRYTSAFHLGESFVLTNSLSY